MISDHFGADSDLVEQTCTGLSVGFSGPATASAPDAALRAEGAIDEDRDHRKAHLAAARRAVSPARSPTVRHARPIDPILQNACTVFEHRPALCGRPFAGAATILLDSARRRTNPFAITLRHPPGIGGRHPSFQNGRESRPCVTSLPVRTRIATP